jgi:hypothetical protein
MAEESQTNTQLERLAELVRVDYDATLRAMHSFIETGGQLRAAGIAAWGVVLGFAIRDASWEVAVLTAALVLIFVYADAYHAALYRRSFTRATQLETLLDAYLNHLGIDDGDEDAEAELLARFKTHRFGMNRSLGKLSFRQMLKARPAVVFRVIYPTLLIISIALATLYAVN